MPIACSTPAASTTRFVRFFSNKVATFARSTRPGHAETTGENWNVLMGSGKHFWPRVWFLTIAGTLLAGRAIAADTWAYILPASGHLADYVSSVQFSRPGTTCVETNPRQELRSVTG
jgi:hypothetical protein